MSLEYVMVCGLLGLGEDLMEAVDSEMCSNCQLMDQDRHVMVMEI